MAVKTITIDITAYGLLARRKGEGESFSDVIKAHFAPEPTARRFREVARALRIDKRALDAMDTQVKARAHSPARAVTR